MVSARVAKYYNNKSIDQEHRHISYLNGTLHSILQHYVIHTASHQVLTSCVLTEVERLSHGHYSRGLLGGGESDAVVYDRGREGSGDGDSFVNRQVREDL